MQEFLELFQGDKPLVIFLNEYMKDILSTLLEKVVNPKKLAKNPSCKDLLDIDVSEDKNLRDAKSIPLNFASKDAIRNADQPTRDNVAYRSKVYVGQHDSENQRDLNWNVTF